MNCIEFEAELANHVETRNAIDSAAIEHASRCPECRVAWQIHQQLEAAIAAWQPVIASSGLTDRVLTELKSTSRTARPFDLAERRVAASQTNAAALIAAAACLLIAVVSLAEFGGSRAHHLARRSPARTRETVAANPPLDVSSTLSEVLSDLRSEYRDIASETRSVAMDLVHRFPSQIEIPISPETDDILLRPTTSDVSRIWAPIGSRVETALGFLWQAVPADIPSG